MEMIKIAALIGMMGFIIVVLKNMNWKQEAGWVSLSLSNHEHKEVRRLARMLEDHRISTRIELENKAAGRLLLFDKKVRAQLKVKERNQKRAQEILKAHSSSK